MNYALYIVTNTRTTKQYVGLTKNLSARIDSHRSANGSAPYLHASIRKHGAENFTFTHIASAPNFECAQFLERLLIVEYNTKVPNGYNLTDGGEGVAGLVFSDASRSKLSAASTAMWRDPVHIEAQRALRATAEYRKLISDTVKLALSDPLVIAKMSKPRRFTENMKLAALARGPQSLSTIARRVAKTRGQTRSAETRAKMSAANKAAWIIRRAKKSTEEGVT